MQSFLTVQWVELAKKGRVKEIQVCKPQRLANQKLRRPIDLVIKDIKWTRLLSRLRCLELRLWILKVPVITK